MRKRTSSLTAEHDSVPPAAPEDSDPAVKRCPPQGKAGHGAPQGTDPEKRMAKSFKR